MNKIFALAIMFLAGAVAPLTAQILVYELEIKPIRSMNLDFYNEGYFVVPPDGGVGSFIFAFKKNGTRSYSVAPGIGRLYFGRKNNDIHAVVEAGEASPVTPEPDPDTNTDTATVGTTITTDASFVAFGEADRKMRFKTALSDNVLRVAEILRGGSVAWAEEAFTGDNIPSHLGFVGVFDLKMDLEKKRTEEYNDRNLSIDQAIDELENLLKSRGYANENDGGEEPDGGDSDGGGTGGGVTIGGLRIDAP